MKEKEASAENKKKKVAGWSTTMLEEVTSRHGVEDTDEVVQRRSISQEGRWFVEDLRGDMEEEEVLEKYKVEEAKTEAYKGRKEPLEWRSVIKEKGFQPPK